MNKLNYKALRVTIALLGCLLIAATTLGRSALAGRLEASGAEQSQVQVKQQSPGQPRQPEAPLTAVGSGFTYQGSLKTGGSPANGQYDFQFTLYDALAGGSLAGGPLTTTNVTVTVGLFAVTLDFGQPAFTGDARYLEIAVRQTGGGAYTTLTPRQPLTPAPYTLSLKPGAVISGTTNAILTVIDNSIYSEGIGVLGASTNGYGVIGDSTNYYAVYGHSVNSYGVLGESSYNAGVRGTAFSGSSLDYAGVYGVNLSYDGIGPGVRGDGVTGPGVFGYSPGNKGVWGQSTTQDGVYGTSDSLSGVAGISNSGNGVYGFSTTNDGVHGNSNSSSGVAGISNSGNGVYGTSNAAGWAGWFDGRVRITGPCCSMGAGTTQIDHPLDPANKYLNQSTVESPDMKTIYDGIATLDATGEAWVDMPSYSQSLNQDFRYQLTPIGAPGRDLYIAQEMQNNRFKIGGGKAGMKVSWQVTGIRHDPYAKQHPVPVEQNKPANEKGKYLYPAGYGQPETMGIGYEQRQRAKQQQQLPPATPGR